MLLASQDKRRMNGKYNLIILCKIYDLDVFCYIIRVRKKSVSQNLLCCVSAARGSSDSERQNLLERLLDAVKQVSKIIIR